MNEYRIFKFASLGLVCCLLLFISGMYSTTINAETKYSEALQKRFQSALKRLGPGYKPRTELLLPNGEPKYTNRLLLEGSPYLIQHAHSSIDWYSWGVEALTKAKTDNKPIFLSMGYSNCYWCDVVEREIFNNELIAKYLNEHFINIKVDRDQRPDLEAYYMTGVTLTTDQGGWPMFSFLMPNGRPFFSGTYFPVEQFRQRLEHISYLWKTQKQALKISADMAASKIAKINSSKNTAQNIDRKVIDETVKVIIQGYDDLQGGFSQAPKFPNEALLFFLLRQLERGANLESPLANAILHTLNEMAQGGIYDQIGGGFHHYSTDNNWLIPHFEKILYNQALLTRIYLKAYQLTGNPVYERIVHQTLDFLLREMRAPEGGFYSAINADGKGEHDRFFVWSEEQITSVLPADLATVAIDLFGVSTKGNFQGRNILHLPVGLNDYAKIHKIELSELFAQVDKIRTILRQAREQRPPLLKDNKIVTAWNGMVISAFAEAGHSLNHPEYLDEAKQTADFLWKHNRRISGRLFHVYQNGTASVPAGQEDYAYLSEALLRLYDTTGEHTWLEKAKQMIDTMLEQFWDKDQGGFFMAAQPNIAAKKSQLKQAHDGEMPSGNSVAVKVLAELAKRSGEAGYQQKAITTIAAFSEQIVGSPEKHPYMLLGVDQLFRDELSDVQYGTQGAFAVRAKLEAVDKSTFWLNIDLSIKPGWYVNSYTNLQKDVFATELTLNDNAKGWHLGSVSYPEPLQKKLIFEQASKLSIYEGQLQLRGKIIRKHRHNLMLPIKVLLQACNDQYCLMPETIGMNISPVTAENGDKKNIM